MWGARPASSPHMGFSLPAHSPVTCLLTEFNRVVYHFLQMATFTLLKNNPHLRTCLEAGRKGRGEERNTDESERETLIGWLLNAP